jgi:exopolysaccharide biosynthesis protein
MRNHCLEPGKGGIALAALLAVTEARGDDLWTRPHAAIRHLHRTSEGVDLHVVLVDLAHPDVAVVATRPGDRFMRTSDFARRYGTRVAINANFYDRASCGLAVGGAEVFADSYEDGCHASMGFAAGGRAAAFDTPDALHAPEGFRWATEVVTGKPWLIRHGHAPMAWQRPQHLYRPNPRSALGLSRDRHTLVVVVADGRRPGAPGLTGFQLVTTLLEFGAHDAMNLDGGGSTTLVIGEHVSNRVSDRAERSVVSHLGIRVR